MRRSDSTSAPPTTRIALDQKVEGPNPSSPANSGGQAGRRGVRGGFGVPEELLRRVIPSTGLRGLTLSPVVSLSANADRRSALADQRMSWTASLRERPAISVSHTSGSIPAALLIARTSRRRSRSLHWPRTAARSPPTHPIAPPLPPQ